MVGFVWCITLLDTEFRTSGNGGCDATTGCHCCLAASFFSFDLKVLPFQATAMPTMPDCHLVKEKGSRKTLLQTTKASTRS